MIVIASYIFYGSWNWRFLSLIMFSTIVDYWIGLRLVEEERKDVRTKLLAASILVNLGLLGIFKYYNFFLESFISSFSFFGLDIQLSSLNVILPVGISFYTFQTLSYTIDIYKGEIKPTKDIISFAAFVSFFPQLVAGPIERARNLLPQFYSKRTFDYSKAVDGMRQILWGLFKKIVIADNCAVYSDLIFNNFNNYSGSVLALGAIFFSFQIYADFSGYSDIAIGTSRLFGFDLMQNFAFPYFSRDIAEFWRRWHISLSTWFKDYVYIPLGGSRGSNWIKVRNVFIVFTLSGLWHGANWTFVVWGLLNALLFLPLLLTSKNRLNSVGIVKGKFFPCLRDLVNISFTFSLVTISWIFFRSESLNHAINYLLSIFSTSLFSRPNFDGFKDALVLIFLIAIFMIFEWFGRNNKYAIEGFGHIQPRVLRWLAYVSILFAIGMYGATNETQFIYFQF